MYKKLISIKEFFIKKFFQKDYYLKHSNKIKIKKEMIDVYLNIPVCT